MKTSFVYTGSAITNYLGKYRMKLVLINIKIINGHANITSYVFIGHELHPETTFINCNVDFIIRLFRGKL